MMLTGSLVWCFEAAAPGPILVGGMHFQYLAEQRRDPFTGQHIAEAETDYFNASEKRVLQQCQYGRGGIRNYYRLLPGGKVLAR